MHETLISMKAYFILLLAVFLNISSCENESSDPSFPFEAEVLGINMDCGIPAIKFNGNLDHINEIAGLKTSNAIFIAKNLPSDLSTEGKTIVLEIRKIENSELRACTTMGPGYPWIYVLEAKEKD
jgi:hypothetical protein